MQAETLNRVRELVQGNPVFEADGTVEILELQKTQVALPDKALELTILPRERWCRIKRQLGGKFQHGAVSCFWTPPLQRIRHGN